MKTSAYIVTLIGLAALMLLSARLVAGGDELPPADGEKFWHYITETDPYQQWDMWPGHQGMVPGKSPHGAHLKIYANDIAIKAAERDEEKLPPGSILVKENYAEDAETLKAVTPMYKIKGYNPDGGGWFWAKYGAAGKVMAAGKVGSCMDCHRSKQAQDWRFMPAGHQHGAHD